MPKTTARTSPAESPAKQTPTLVITGQERTPQRRERFSRLIEKVRESAKEDLAIHFERFTEKADPEEIRFLKDVLDRWDSENNLGMPRSPSDREVPLFNAIQYQLNQNTLVEVPDEDMVPAVELCIAELAKRRWERKQAAAKPVDNSEEGRIARLEEQVRDEMEYFVRDAHKASLSLMVALLARWNQLHGDTAAMKAINESGEISLLAAAMEVELEKLYTQRVVDTALKAKA